MKKMKLFLALLLSLLLTVPPSALADVIGTITYIEGRVDKLDPGKEQYFPLVIGEEVSHGDVIRTKSHSKTEITFNDDSLVRLGDSSQIKITEYEINDLGEREKGVVDLERGTLRAIVSKSKGEASFDINTPNALGSVKGSDVFVSYLKSTTGTLVADGILRITNPLFPEEAINIRKGETSFVPHNAPPEEPRIYIPVEKESLDTKTGPTIRKIKGILEDKEITRVRVVRFIGSVKIKPADAKEWHAPIVNEVLNVGDVIDTGENGRVEVIMDNGNILELKPNTQVIIKLLTREPKTGDYQNSFECKYGKIIAKLKKIEGKSSFEIKTPNAVCGIRGTIMYLEVLPNLTRAFFEGGDGFITSLISNITRIVNAGQTSSADDEGNVTDPTDTTDEDRENFGSGFGDEGGDTYGYTPGGDDVGDDLTGAGFGPGTPEPGEGAGEGPFDEVPQGPGTTGEGETAGLALTNLSGSFTGYFGEIGSFWVDEESSIDATLTSTTSPAPWSGTSTVDVTGTYGNPNEKTFWAGELIGTADDGGAFIGWAAGRTYASWDGVISALYIDPSGAAGTIFGYMEGENDDLTGTLTGSGGISINQVDPTEVPPGELSDSLEISEEIPAYFLGIFDFVGDEDIEEIDEEDVGFIEVESSFNTMNIEEETWGIWGGVFEALYNNPRPLTSWTGFLLGALGEFFEEDFFEEDFFEIMGSLLLGIITGTDDLAGSLVMDIAFFTLDFYSLSIYEGTILGTYEEADSFYYEGIGLGTYRQEPLTFSGLWGWDDGEIGSLYYNDEGYVSPAGEEYGFIGSSISPWLGPSEFVGIGGFESDGLGPYIWNTPIYSFNFDDYEYTTYDGGAFFGFTGGIWNDFSMDGSLVALYLDPNGNAGFLRGDIFGFYFPLFEAEEGIWSVFGTLSPTQMESELEINPILFGEYIDNGYLNGSLYGDFNGEGYIEAEVDWGDTYFIHDYENQTGYPWGIYDLKLEGSDTYYNPDPEENTDWSAVIGGEGNFGVYYYEYNGGEWDGDWGYWLADITGTWENGEVRGDLSGDYITYTHLGTIQGDLFGINNGENGTWIGESLGTWEGDALDFAGEVDGGLLYFDGKGFDSDGWSYGLLGGFGDLWSGEPVPVTFMGDYELENGDDMPYLWFGSGWYIYSYNAYTGEDTTFDGGAFFGFAGGSWADGVMDGRGRALFIAPGAGPTWNAGILYCGYGNAIDGIYYPEIEMWQAEGDFIAEIMGVTEVDPRDLVWGDIDWDSFWGEGTGSLLGGGELEGIADAGTFLNIYDQNWGIWNAGFGGTYEGPTSPFTFAVGGSSGGGKYFLATINGDWESGGISGLFRGIFMEEGDIGISAGSMTGDVVGNYIEGEETWQAVGVGEWIELAELDPEILGFDLDDLSEFVEIPITETYASLLASPVPGSFDAGGTIAGEAILSIYNDEIWTALISGAYSGPTSDAWSLDLVNGGDSITLAGDLWSDSEWHALVDGSANGGTITGEAGGTFADGEFLGVGAGTYTPGE